MSRWFCAALLSLIFVTAACAPAPTATPAPTFTPLPTETPAATATPLPTRAPLPTAIPTEVREQSLTEARLSERAKIRTVHAAPDFEEVDVYLGNQTIGFSLRFGDTSGQADVVAGDYFLRFISIGGRPEDAPLLQVPISLSSDEEIVVVLLPDDEVKFFEENNEPLSEDEVRVRVINAIPNSPSTALPVEGTPNALAFTPVGYGEQSEPVIYTPGEKELDFADILDDYEINLFRRRAYTFVLAGNLVDPTVIYFDETVPALAAISIVNVSEEIGAVDVYLNGDLLTSDLAYKSGDDLFTLPVNTYNVIVYEAGADPAGVTPLLERAVTLNPDDEVFVLVMGPADDLQLITHQESPDPTRADETRITFVNTISSVPRLTEIRQPDQQINITYAQPTTLTYRDGMQNFEFVTNLTQDGYATIDVVVDREYEEGHSYLVLLTGAGNEGEPPLIYETVVGTLDFLDPNEESFEQPQLHVINTIDRTISLLIDGTIYDSTVDPGESTEVFTLASHKHTITITDEATQEEIYSTERTLQDDNRYTYVLFGDLEADNYAIVDFENVRRSPTFVEQSGATVRVINTSLNTSQRLALAYRDAAAPDDRPTAQDPDTEPIPLPLDSTGFTNLAVTSGEASVPITIPSRPFDLFVYDASTRTIEAAVYNMVLEPDTNYELIVTAQEDIITPYTAYLVESPMR